MTQKIVVKIKERGPQGIEGPPGAAGGSFLDLSDTPVSYAGAAGYGVQVTAGEDGLEFTAHAPGSGDMTAAVYDPTTIAADVFDMDNMVQGLTNFFLNATEYGNLHAPNSDDQDLSGLVPYTGATGDVSLGVHSIAAANLSGNNTGDQVASDFNHDDLASISGGGPADYQHLTTVQLGNIHAPGSDDQVASDFNHDDLSALTGSGPEYGHVNAVELAAITHANRSNLDSIDQDLAKADNVVFNSVNIGSELTGVIITGIDGELSFTPTDPTGVTTIYFFDNSDVGREAVGEFSWSGDDLYFLAYASGGRTPDLILWPQGDNVQINANLIPVGLAKDIGVSGGTTWDNLYLDESVNAAQMNFDLTAGITVTQGQLAWNADEETLDLGQNGAVLQIGQEIHYHVRNNSGAQIDDGTPVMATGTIGASGRITIAPMDATDHANERYFLGITTEDIANDTDGKVSEFGKVRGLDTTGALSFGGLETWNDGDILYLDPANVGYLTNVEPTGLDINMPVAFVILAHTNGTIFVRATHTDLNHYVTRDQQQLTLDPTGWVDNTAIQVDYDEITRTITLTGDLRYYWRGVLKELTSPWTSSAHSATTDQTYFLYTTDGETFSWSTTVWDFDMMMVAFAYYGATHQYGVREVHGLMPWQTHREFHARQGTYKVSGGTLSGYTLSSTTAADRRPTVSATVLNDEDIYTTLPEWDVDILGATQFYLSGAGGASNFATGATDIVPLSGNQPYWNEFTGGTWQQTLLSNNQYMAVWLVGVPVTEDSISQGYRYWWVQGQSADSTLSAIQARSPLDLNLGAVPTITPEFTFLSKVILRYTAGNWQLIQVDVLSGSRAQVTSGASGNYLSIVSTDTTLTGTGTGGDPLSVANDGHTHDTQYIPGPGTVTDNAVVRFDGVTGLIIQESLVTITDAGAISATNLVLSGNWTHSNGYIHANGDVAGSSFYATNKAHFRGGIDNDTGAFIQCYRAFQCESVSDYVTLKVIGDSGQSADLVQVLNSGLSEMFVVDNVGNVEVAGGVTTGDDITLPASGEVKTLSGSLTIRSADDLLLGGDGSLRWFINNTGLFPLNSSYNLGSQTYPLNSITADGDIAANNMLLAGYLNCKGLTDELTATAGNTFAAGDVGIMVAAGTITLADADAEATTKGMLVMATEAISGGAAGTFLLMGKVTGLTGLTQGSTYYVSPTTGEITATPPSGGQFLRVVGHATSTTEFMFNPSQTWIETT